MPSRLFTALLALSAPLAASAQISAAFPIPRAYLGLALYTSEYQPLSFTSDSYYGSRRLPVQLTAGYQLRPRLAVQASVAYSYNQSSYAGSGSDLAQPGGVFSYYNFSGYSSRRNTSLALLGRYTLTHPAAHRLQVDALGGVTLEKQQFKRAQYRTYYDSSGNYISATDYSNRNVVTGLLAAVGVGLRYRLVPRLDATFNGTANIDFLGNFSGLSSSLALGLRANIGQLP